MIQHDFKLFFFPGTCARVSMIALEELQTPFSTQLVVFMRGEHKSPEYLKLNPKGKVPTLLVDDKPLTETTAILQYLNEEYPQAGLLPNPPDAWGRAQLRADLGWLNGTLQPLVTGILFPQLFCAEPESAKQRTRKQFMQLITPHIDLLEARLQQQPWLLGQQWSILDGLAWWIWDQILFGGYDASGRPALAAHAERSRQRPSIQRALQREGEAFGWMAAQGIKLPPPPTAG